MIRFFQGLACVLFGCKWRRVSKAAVQLGNERIALHVCDRCDSHLYLNEANQ